MRTLLVVPIIAIAAACGGPARTDHGPIAENISAPLGQPVPFATAEQLATFDRGRAVALRRFTLQNGLGPVFNTAFCASCHEKPTPGGSSGLYRNFVLAGRRLDGAFFAANTVPLFDCGTIDKPPEQRVVHPPPESLAGAINGVVRIYGYGDDINGRPDPESQIDVIAKRNPIPFYGVGLLAEIDAEEIRSRADPDDRDGDGISGRVNLVGGFVGRFGRKAQTTSIEGFIRGPLYNHLGITSDPLTDEQRSRLPVDSSDAATTALNWVGHALSAHAQAAAPGTPNCDLDDAPDPELSPDDLFDLISWAMLLAAPRIEPLNDQRQRGLQRFDEAGCGGCHTPRLKSPRGPLPVYSDLLLHDMGPDLGDGTVQGEATGSEFRTQPLWGLAATGPYLHDGRASTIEEAIMAHGGEATAARDYFAAFDADQRADLIEFLMSLGGRDQKSDGLIPPNQPPPAAGSFGGPIAGLSASELQRFEAGRLAFDQEFGLDAGAGGPRFNGDSCRACHFDPVVGGSGPRGVNVMRQGILNSDGDFVVPAVGTVLHRQTGLYETMILPQEGVNIFEHRQAPPLFGLGLIDELPDDVILANADPDDADGDGISGRASISDGGRLGRFGWKAQVPSLAEFVRDGVTTELGMTLPPQDGLTFGAIDDNDDVADPELGLDYANKLLDFMKMLGPPPRQLPADPSQAETGELLFTAAGCARCHTPALNGPHGPVPLYSDMLLHEILPPNATGIEEVSANMREMRTAPLWGLRASAPYWHSGEADTIDEAIRLHDGEAAAIRDIYVNEMTQAQRDALIAFLESL